MTDQQIFNHLFKIAKTSKDPEGVVAACLVKDGKIVVSSASSDDGKKHAEYLVIERAKEQKVGIDNNYALYTTLEPCSDLPAINDGRDCATCIIDTGIKNIVYAANDPEYSTKAAKRLKRAGINYTQIKDKNIIRKSADLFNATIKVDLAKMKLPRKKRL